MLWSVGGFCRWCIFSTSERCPCLQKVSLNYDSDGVSYGLDEIMIRLDPTGFGACRVSLAAEKVNNDDDDTKVSMHAVLDRIIGYYW